MTYYKLLFPNFLLGGALIAISIFFTGQYFLGVGDGERSYLKLFAYKLEPHNMRTDRSTDT